MYGYGYGRPTGAGMGVRSKRVWALEENWYRRSMVSDRWRMYGRVTVAVGVPVQAVVNALMATNFSEPALLDSHCSGTLGDVVLLLLRVREI